MAGSLIQLTIIFSIALISFTTANCPFFRWNGCIEPRGGEDKKKNEFLARLGTMFQSKSHGKEVSERKSEYIDEAISVIKSTLEDSEGPENTEKLKREKDSWKEQTDLKNTRKELYKEIVRLLLELAFEDF